MPVPVAGRSATKFLAILTPRLLTSRFLILLRAWMLVFCLYMLWCSKQRPCNELIIHPRSHAVCVCVCVCVRSNCDAVTGVTLEKQRKKILFNPARLQLPFWSIRKIALDNFLTPYTDILWNCFCQYWPDALDTFAQVITVVISS